MTADLTEANAASQLSTEETILRLRKTLKPSHATETGHFPGWALDWFWIVVALLFAAFVLSTLDRHGIWTDELGHFKRLHDPAPWRGRLHPLHLMIARADVLLFGFSDYSLRLPFALFAIAAIPLGYALGRLLGGKTLGRFTCLILATSPYLLHYARDANYYAEIMTYTLLGVWGAVAFIETGALLHLSIALLAMAAMTLTHPLSGVCAVSLGCSLLAATLVQPHLRGALARQFGGHHRRRSLILCVAVGLALALIGWKFGHMASNVIQKAWSLLAWHGGFQNLDLSWTFVVSALSEYSGGVLGVTPVSVAVAAVYALAAGVGLVALARRDGWKILPVLFPFLATILLLRFLKIDRFFHIRYIDYLAPLWLALVAAGAYSLGQAWFRHAPFKRWTQWAPLVILLAIQSPQFHEYATFGGGYLKDVMRYLKSSEAEFGSEDRVLIIKHFGPREEAEKFGIDTSQFVTLPFNPLAGAGQQRLQAAYARQFFARTPDSWVLLHWNAPNFIDTELRHALIENCTPVLAAQSIFELSSIQDYHRGLFDKPPVPVVRAELFRWNWPNRYVCPPQPLEVNLAVEAQWPLEDDWKVKRGFLPPPPKINGHPRLNQNAAPFNSKLLFERGGHYAISLTPPAGRQEIAYRCKIDGQDLVRLDSATSVSFVFTAQIKSGEHLISISPVGEVDVMQNGTLWLPTLRIEPDLTHPVRIDPLMFTRTNTANDYLLGDRIDGRMALVFDRAEGVDYDLHFQRAGNYQFSFEAQEDQPGPVYFEVALDGRPRAVLTFDRADMSWSRQSIVEPLAAGKHTLTVNYLSEHDLSHWEPELNNNLALSDIEIAPADKPRPDDRLNFAASLLPPPPGIANGFASVRTGSKESDWDFMTYMGTQPVKDVRLTFEPDPDSPWPGSVMPHFEVPPDSTSTLLASPIFPVEPNKAFYYRAEIRLEMLTNHSANMQLLLFDKDMAPIDVIHARGAGTTGTTPWITFAWADVLPEDAAFAAVACVVYQNGKMPYRDRGEVWFRRLEFPMAGQLAPQILK